MTAISASPPLRHTKFDPRPARDCPEATWRSADVRTGGQQCFTAGTEKFDTARQVGRTGELPPSPPLLVSVSSVSGSGVISGPPPRLPPDGATGGQGVTTGAEVTSLGSGRRQQSARLVAEPPRSERHGGAVMVTAANREACGPARSAFINEPVTSPPPASRVNELTEFRPLARVK